MYSYMNISNYPYNVKLPQIHELVNASNYLLSHLAKQQGWFIGETHDYQFLYYETVVIKPGQCNNIVFFKIGF